MPGPQMGAAMQQDITRGVQTAFQGRSMATVGGLFSGRPTQSRATSKAARQWQDHGTLRQAYKTGVKAAHGVNVGFVGRRIAGFMGAWKWAGAPMRQTRRGFQRRAHAAYARGAPQSLVDLAPSGANAQVLSNFAQRAEKTLGTQAPMSPMDFARGATAAAERGGFFKTAARETRWRRFKVGTKAAAYAGAAAFIGGGVIPTAGALAGAAFAHRAAPRFKGLAGLGSLVGINYLLGGRARDIISGGGGQQYPMVR